MTPEELSRKLSSMYGNAPHGEAATTVHLFGIRYAEDIRNSPKSVAAIVRGSGLRSSYVTEVHKGVALARHVVERRPAIAKGSAPGGWVAGLLQRRPVAYFDKLREQVERDADEFDSLPDRYKRVPAGMKMVREETADENRFMVERTWGTRTDWIVFALALGTRVVQIEPSGRQNFSVRLEDAGRTDDGTYRVVLERGEERVLRMPFEQSLTTVSRLALEPLTFDWPQMHETL